MQSQKRSVTEMDTSAMQNILSGYLLRARAPFQWGCYNHLGTTQAASGAGLTLCADFLSPWLSAFPEAMAGGSKKFVALLDGLVACGTCQRFPPGHMVWEGLLAHDPVQRKTWAERQYNKVLCCLNHIRRLRSNEVKRAQACKGLTEEQLDIVDNLISLLPRKAALAAPLPSSGAQSSHCLSLSCAWEVAKFSKTRQSPRT